MDGMGFRFAVSADDIEAELRRIEGNAGMAVNAIALLAICEIARHWLKEKQDGEPK